MESNQSDREENHRDPGVTRTWRPGPRSLGRIWRAQSFWSKSVSAETEKGHMNIQINKYKNYRKEEAMKQKWSERSQLRYLLRWRGQNSHDAVGLCDSSPAGWPVWPGSQTEDFWGLRRTAGNAGRWCPWSRCRSSSLWHHCALTTQHKHPQTLREETGSGFKVKDCCSFLHQELMNPLHLQLSSTFLSSLNVYNVKYLKQWADSPTWPVSGSSASTTW